MLRIYLSGRMSIEGDDGVLIQPGDFPGQQGRAAFAVLVGERHAPITRTALADALWPAELPPSWESALSAILSKLRSLLGRAGLDASALTTRDGCHELRLPTATWIDHEVAADRIHEAEAALKAGDPAAAYGPSAVAHHIARRPFLPAETGPWFERRRERLAGILVRALECRAQVYIWNREFPLALEVARQAIALQPFRETGHQLLMRAHAGAGNTAEALRAYEQCRAMIADELGVSPSPETRALHTELLRSL
ncbi:MAG TPA: bacterial transcriptional activator domain-containing protein [Longimicrobiales bacterium]|nr:bacterial transcriptional activator domain-containing protein [Longimicrobiales bacterium]